MRKANRPIPTPQVVQALVDTGASITCIDPSVMTALDLDPKGTVDILTPSSGGGGAKLDQYDVGIVIIATQDEPRLQIGTVGAVASDLTAQGIGALIGRDVLSMCILHYDGSIGQFSLAY